MNIRQKEVFKEFIKDCLFLKKGSSDMIDEVEAFEFSGGICEAWIDGEPLLRGELANGVLKIKNFGKIILIREL